MSKVTAYITLDKNDQPCAALYKKLKIEGSDKVVTVSGEKDHVEKILDMVFMVQTEDIPKRNAA